MLMCWQCILHLLQRLSLIWKTFNHQYIKCNIGLYFKGLHGSMLGPGSLTVDKQNYTSPQEFNCVIIILKNLLGINWGLPETKWFGWVGHWLTHSLSILGVGGLDQLRVSLSQFLVLFSHSSPSVFMDKSMGKFLVYYILAYYRAYHYIFS